MEQEQEWFQNYFVVRCDAGDPPAPYYACSTRTGFASPTDENAYQNTLFIFASRENADAFIEGRGKSRRKFSNLTIEPLTAEICGGFTGWQVQNHQPQRRR